MDFIRGASLSEGGKAIIAMPSITSRGVSKIVSMLKPGARSNYYPGSRTLCSYRIWNS
ncbi:MAG: acetyl-CoA hydrolase/transferase C-terminal domain-containing protein [Owenweeksia sp.]|nr:acetyl-CoA hydrolase/transferase C-terminal domain-containing protein [Owenweeksia sp.]